MKHAEEEIVRWATARVMAGMTANLLKWTEGARAHERGYEVRSDCRNFVSLALVFKSTAKSISLHLESSPCFKNRSRSLLTILSRIWIVPACTFGNMWNTKIASAFRRLGRLEKSVVREILYYDGEESKLFVEKPGILWYPKLVYRHSEVVNTTIRHSPDIVNRKVIILWQKSYARE